MAELLSPLKVIAVVLVVWTLVSIVATLLLVPWLRARARANEALSQRDRGADWASAAQPDDGRKIADG
jgi:membrane protein implicated in regulation of membrane protease activity